MILARKTFLAQFLKETFMAIAVLSFTFLGFSLVPFAHAIKQIVNRDVAEDGDSSYGEYIWGL
jgi:hypothetical protein